MGRIMNEAEDDCAKSGVTVRYKITEVSFYDFLSEYEPVAEGEAPAIGGTPLEHLDPRIEANPEPELEDRGHQVTESQPESEQVVALRQVIEQKDEELGQKDDELGRKDDDIALLKAHLRQLQQPSAGQPPV
jgi:hypothetical protein